MWFAMARIETPLATLAMLVTAHTVGNDVQPEG